MAKSQINTKSSSYMRDKEAFMKELRQFNESKNITLKPPIVNGIELDLYLFYSLVQQRGGIGKVNQSDVWESFLRPLRLPHPCINGSTLLRRIYGIHLEKFERARGPPGRDDDLDLEEELTRRGRGSHMPRIMFSGGTYISASGEALRTAQKPTATHSERLALSLLSPMPNEQDFAVNVCTVLAADHSNRLPLAATPHILDFLLAHAGVYNHPSLRDTIGRSYFEARGRYPDEFWKMRAGGGGAKELADETKFTLSIDGEPELMVQAMAAHNNLTDCLTMDGQDDEVEKIAGDYDIMEDWVTEPSEESQLFAPTLAGGAGCVYTQRVLQIASIVRSLSFHEENVQYLAKNNTLIRFLLLCANCWVGTLRQSGFDTLGNVSTELIIKDPATCLISRHVLSTIQSALVSPDRARVLAALELLNKLAQNELNEDALLKALEAKVYADVCALLSLRDIMVLVCTLECVYALTSLGDRASEAVARVPGLIHTLVSLVTVEAQSYGPKACILMRVVETVSGPSALAAVAEREPQSQPQTQPQTQPQPQPQTPQKQVQEQAPPSPAVSVPGPSASTLQQSHMQQRTVQENEHFALAWLRSSYEPLPANDNSTYDSGELYKLYLTCCTKLSRKGVISPAHFPRLVRTVFGGTVGPNQVTLASGETQQVYVGIRSRNQNRTTIQQGPASPILKAQLTNKPGVGEVKTPVSTAQTQQATPHLSSALESNPTNTTLIKHLLAHKVSPALPSLQVAQRQQNQQQGRSPNTVVVQPPTQALNVDPEEMIKCTAITPCGVASITPGSEQSVNEDQLVLKEEPVQIQIDEQTQLTISNQNKMLADLLEKKSNPPVQVVQMTPQMGAPTIQINESGQIVQVKQEAPVIQISEAGLVSSGQFFQIKNDQGQIIQIKNEQGQIIHLKSDQMQQPIIQYKSDIKSEPVPQLIQGVVQIKTDKDIPDHLSEHAYTEPPSKKVKIEEKRDSHAPQETASKTAANLYAALAASALEDEEDLLPPPAVKQETDSGSSDQSMIIQEPIMQVQQPNRQGQQQTMIQQPNLQVQGNSMQMQQSSLQVQQPMIQVQPMDVQNIIQSQSGQLILQDKSMGQQQQYMQQQQMQIIAAPSNSQGGISYITQNIPSNMMQKTIIIVQGPTGGGPLTLTVNNPGGLDEATLNSLIAQATEAITQQQIIQSAPQLTQSQQPVLTTQPQPHKAQIINQGQQQQIVVTQKNPPALISTATGNTIPPGQQIIVANNQQIIMNAPHKPAGHKFTPIQPQQRQTVLQSTESKKSQPIVRQVITRQPIMVGNTKIGEKETIVNQPVIAERQAPSPLPSPHTPPLDDTPWICHWRGCGKSFESASSVFSHAARAHCPGGAGGEAPCLWLDCDRVPRRTFALLNHLTDKHCSPSALKAVYNSRKHAAAEAEANKPVSLGYPPNAALAALNKHAADMFNPRELMDENEGPVTKSIRLTAALILRNIVIYSNTGRRQLRSYESHLSSIAISSVEASRTIAQVLFDMNNI